MFRYQYVTTILIALIGLESCNYNLTPDLFPEPSLPIIKTTKNDFEIKKVKHREVKNPYLETRKLEKDLSKVVSFSAKKKLKVNDYTKILLAQARYTATEWDFFAIHNENEERKNCLKNLLIGNRFVYFQKINNKNKTFTGFYSDFDNNFSQSIIHEVYAGAGNKPIKERTNVSTLSSNPFGLEADFLNIPFLFWCLGERNGAFIKAKFGDLKMATYTIVKFFIVKSTRERFLKLENKTTKDIIYLKSVEDHNRKIELPAFVVKNVNKHIEKLNKIKGNNRPIKGLVYGISALHFLALLPIEVANIAGVTGGILLGLGFL